MAVLETRKIGVTCAASPSTTPFQCRWRQRSSRWARAVLCRDPTRCGHSPER